MKQNMNMLHVHFNDINLNFNKKIKLINMFRNMNKEDQKQNTNYIEVKFKTAWAAMCQDT